MTKVIAFGTFDIIHPGHIFFLQKAKALGNHLTVIVARDETVSALKGWRPRHNEQTRLRNLRRLKIADKARLGNLDDKLRVLREEKPDIIALGYDQKFFVKLLKAVRAPRWRIHRLKAYHPELLKTSKLAPRDPEQLLVTLALLVKNRRLLLIKRRDPRPEFNGIWEFPGGGVEFGETVEQALRRETEEETGYKIRILYQLPGIPSAVRKPYNFQVFLVCFLVAATAGRLRLRDEENSAARWCTLKEALKTNQFELNKKIIRDNMELLKRYID